MEDLLQVGILSSTHGVKGEMKVFPTTDDVKRFKKIKNIYSERVVAMWTSRLRVSNFSNSLSF